MEQLWSDAALAVLSARREARPPLRSAYVHKATQIAHMLGTRESVLDPWECVCILAMTCMPRHCSQTASSGKTYWQQQAFSTSTLAHFCTRACVWCHLTESWVRPAGMQHYICDMQGLM